jgi:carbamoyl-phosphate synthase large subunit
VPRRPDIHSVLIIGSGPIVIGQACEFDYSGTQACKALKEEGIRVVLVNSNPATIMTDPEFADRTYIEPVVPEVIEKVLEQERRRGTVVDSVLPTLGGQTGLNCAMACHEQGIFERYGVKMLAASPESIRKAEDRLEFREAMKRIGLDVPRSGIARNWEDAQRVITDVKLPCAIRPAFTLGGTGGGFARTPEEFTEVCKRGLAYSPVHQILIEESLWGWKEFELEVMRDRADNVVVICSIENFDAMGVHTGDSITVAPAQTLTDKEYQRMRDAALAIMREIGVDTGGSNIQFAVHPRTGRQCVIEMNPRVSRSSALASKATGFPIAKIAAKLAIGYTLDEIPNDITRTTPACFEPALDYCVVKIPRWTFEKFPEADETLTTQMKSVGEGMAIGRTFKEAFQKCIRSMEIKRFGLGLDFIDKAPRHSLRRTARAAARVAQPVAVAVGAGPGGGPDAGADEAAAIDLPVGGSRSAVESVRAVAGGRSAEAPADTAEERAARWPIRDEILLDKLARPAQGRIYYIRYAFKLGWSVQRVHELSGIDPWFLENIRELVQFEEELFAASPATIRRFLGDEAAAGDQSDSGLVDLIRRAKSYGYSDVQLAHLWGVEPRRVREFGRRHGVAPSYRLVDTCAAEFAAATPYYYSTYEAPVGRWASGNVGRGADSSVQTSPHSHLPAIEDELRESGRPKVVVLGGGPNRIGQGIEFDYCCVHAAMAARELGYEAVMINSNPETVSTDYDTSDLLFFEPLTHEDVLNVCERLAAPGPAPRSPDGRDSSTPASRRVELMDVGDIVAGAPLAAIPREARRTIAEELTRMGVACAAFVLLSESWPQAPGGRRRGYTVLLPDGRCPRFIFDGGAAPTLIRVEADTRPHVNVELSSAEISAVLSRLSDRAARGPATVDAGDTRLVGVICQFGGQTPLNLAMGLKRAGVPILGTSPESIHMAEDREQFSRMLDELGLQQPPSGIARSFAEARAVADRIGYPVLVRPSYVLGGRAMEVCNSEAELRHYMARAVETAGEHPILIDRFLSDAIEVDVDAISDGERVVICGVLEHIEEAGIHSGDSAMTLPPYSLSAATVQQISYAVRLLARRIGVVGLMNVQLAIKEDDIYVLEVNPRASRTIPFIAKATGIPWAKIAAKVMLGKTLTELGVTEATARRHMSVKVSVFPFHKFPGVDVALGPEMRSTGEVMGVDERFSLAFAKAQMGASVNLPTEGRVFVSVNDRDKPFIPTVARDLIRHGFALVCTEGTARTLRAAGMKVEVVAKIREGERGPNPLELIERGEIKLVINTPARTGRHTDEGKIRAAAALHRIPIYTTITGARAAVAAIGALKRRSWDVHALQDLWT